ncbi:MAG: methyltransferase domain-containing protein, partial [Bacteroidota bacterium]
MNETSCYLCGQRNFFLLHNKGRNNKKVENFVCNNCGFVMVLPRPNTEFFDEQYKDSQFSKEARGSQRPDKKKLEQTDKRAEQRFEYIAEHDSNWLYEIEKSSPKQFLEVGCGTGSFLRLMKAVGWDAEGIEPDGDYTASVEEDF